MDELEGSTMTTTAHRVLTESATDIYRLVDFESNATFNEPAPEPWISLLIGCVFLLLSIVLWVRRIISISKRIGQEKYSQGSVRFRTWITAYIDNDDPLYTCTKMACQSFIFLYGLQMNYRMAFSIMLGFFALESTCDSLRIWLSFREADSIDEVIVTSKAVRTELRKHPLTVLEPNNVYEDLTRGTVIVLMVFITQTILVSFVVSCSN